MIQLRGRGHNSPKSKVGSAARAVLPFYPSPIYYLCFFFFGYLLFASKPIEAAVRKCLWSAALLVLVLSPVVLHLYTRQTFDDGLLFTMFPFNSITERLLVELVAFSWLLLVYGLARRFVKTIRKTLHFCGGSPDEERSDQV